MSETALNGKKTVGIIAAVVIVLQVLGLLLGGINGGSIVRLLLTAGLMYMAYEGKNWARITTIVLCILSSIGTLIIGLAAFLVSPLVAIIVLAQCVGTIAMVVILIGNKSVKEYFESSKIS